MTGGERRAWRRARRPRAALALAPGAPVADLGAGTGYLTFRLAGEREAAGHPRVEDLDFLSRQSFRIFQLAPEPTSDAAAR